MSKLDIKKLEAGKRYRMVIEAETNMGDITNLPSIEFIVPEAAPLARSNKLSIQKVSITENKVAKNKLFLTIPENIISNLIWKNDVRDIVHIIYRSGVDSESLTSSVKYLIGDGSVSYGTVPSVTFNDSDTSNIWRNGHPNTFTKLLLGTDKKYYSFQFVVARYVNISGSWTGYWLHPGKSLKQIISQQSGWKA